MPDTLFVLLPGGSGIPASLVELAKQKIRDHERKRKRNMLPYNAPAHFNEVWIVFDTEAAQLAGRLFDGVNDARNEKFKIAHSTPCFEFWLALHFKPDAPPMTNCLEATRHLKKIGGTTCDGYDKKREASKMIMKALVPSVNTAVTNAEIVTRNQKGEDFPANPSTAVHLLVKSLKEGTA